MMRMRVLALLLAVSVVCCTPVFFASATDDELCAISVEVDGSGTVTMNGIADDSEINSNLAPGVSVTMTAEPSADCEFLFWVNKETDRIISWNATYTFTVASYASYEAVFDSTESSLAGEGYHTVIYLTQGDNIICNSVVALDDASYIEDIPTNGVHISGKTWIGWDKTAADVAATPGRVFVRPLYNTDKKFTVTSIINGVTTSYEKLYTSSLKLVAPAQQNGEAFSYWLAKAKDVNSWDEIASFNATFEFVVTGDVTLEAIYGVTVEEGVAARISGDFPSFDERTITIAAQHSVKSNYTVTQHGILITMDMEVGSFDDSFVINQSDTRIMKFTSKDTTRTGTYRIDLDGWNPVTSEGGTYTYYPRLYARAYVKVRDRSGVTSTFYSRRYCVDYVFSTGEGGGDNHDDPTWD